MKLLHRMILRNLPGPFFGWLGTLMFLLVMQFLIRYLPDIAGKGLSLFVIVELIAYNLAYMVVLAVPMAVLLASLMTFGRLAETNAYAVIKNAGVSLPQLLWPVALAGLLLTGGMLYFNNVVLPEANFRAKALWKDIRHKKPGFELEEGVFYEGIRDYSILVGKRPFASNTLLDVTIYDYTEGPRRQAVIKAERGRLVPSPDGHRMDLVLEHGEMHRLIPHPTATVKERYERMTFGEHRLTLDLSDFAFERSEPRESYRSDRTTPTLEMIRYVDSLQTHLADTKGALLRDVMTLGAAGSPAEVAAADSAAASRIDTAAAFPNERVALQDLSLETQTDVYNEAVSDVRAASMDLDDARRTIVWESQRANRYAVEIHKKLSIAMACLIFMLIGAPLGLSIRRGGLGTVGGLALAIFMFYWITLVQGEKFADRGLLPPWLGMWIANAVMALVGLWLLLYVWFDLRATPPLHRRFFRRTRRDRHPTVDAGTTPPAARDVRQAQPVA